MRVAIVHYWLLGMRGGERVVEALCRMLPDADLFTLFYDPERVSPTIREHRVTASYLNPVRRWYRSLLPLFPAALESLDLRDYDLVISSESGPAKGVLTHSGCRHVCYCHTPMRYLWDLYPAYANEWTSNPVKRWALRAFAPQLRLWDYATAARVDEFVANSENVRRRIWKTYRREATVVYPPVSVESFYYRLPENYFLIVSELVPYKQIDYACELFSRSGRRLRIVGHGPDYKHLKRISAPNIEFCGRVGEAELRDLYARSQAVIMPGEEDFGIVPVEALASGKPVIALGKGGALESVPPRTLAGGILYLEPSEVALDAAIAQFDRVADSINPKDLQQWAARFSEAEFALKMRYILDSPLRIAQRVPDSPQ